MGGSNIPHDTPHARNFEVTKKAETQNVPKAVRTCGSFSTMALYKSIYLLKIYLLK